VHPQIQKNTSQLIERPAVFREEKQLPPALFLERLQQFDRVRRSLLVKRQERIVEQEYLCAVLVFHAQCERQARG
jgi:hypothetical protein